MGVSNIWDPKQNIEGGVKYMRYLMDLFNGDARSSSPGPASCVTWGTT